MRVWTEIAQCVAASGIRKLLIFNTHGGNVGLLDVVARDLRARLGMLVYTCSWFNLPLGDAADVFDAHEHRFGIHAGAIETSLMLALHPEQVQMQQAQNFPAHLNNAPPPYPFWVMAAAPSWLGRCRITTPTALWAMPQRPTPTKAGRCYTPQARPWPLC